jgi:hypothetical protein
MYVSTELTHFVGANLGPDKTKQFELLVAIVTSGILSSNPDLAFTNWANIFYGQPLEWRGGEFFGLSRVCVSDLIFSSRLRTWRSI